MTSSRTGRDLALDVRRADARDAPALERLLRAGMPQDAWMLHQLAARGVPGFVCVTGPGGLVGAALQRGGAVSAARATPPEPATALAARLSRFGRWGSVVGPDPPCGDLVAALTGTVRPRVDREQVFMTVGDAERLGPGEPRLRPACAADLDELVPLIARYRVEDGLAPPGEDQRRWIRVHSQARIDSGMLFVVERTDGIVFSGAFNFLGKSGAGLGGIYTRRDARCAGLAARATASLCRIALRRGPVATLHVAADNAPALRCYERAGFARAGRFRLTFR